MTTLNFSTSPQDRDATPQPLRLTRRDLVAIGLLVASLVGMFWRVLFTSAMFFYRDIYNYTYPSARFIHDLCRQGFLPYWSPYLNYGQPVLANPNLLFFYPYTLLIVLLPVDIAYTLHYVLHFALAGIGAYLLARVWGQSCPAAFFAAFVFAFSGPVLSLGNFYNTSACCAWIPWALLATDRALESKRLRPWVLLTVVFSLQWLAGEPLTMMATFGLSFAYALYRCSTQQGFWSKASLRVFTIFLLVGCGILLLCAAQLLPASDLLSHSKRGQGLSFRETTRWSVHPFSLLGVLIPNFFGPPGAGATAWLWLMSDENVPYNLSDFLGFVPLFFALAGWRLGSDRRRNFVAGAAAILLLLSFGHFTPVFALARLLLPFLIFVRYPIKMFVHLMLLVAILAGWGLDALRSTASPWKAHGRRLVLPLQIFLGCIVIVLAAAWVLPGLITAPTRWLLRAHSDIPFALGPMPDSLVAMFRFQLPGLAGFCLGGLALLLGLEQSKKWARPGLYAFALLAMGYLALVNSEANPTVAKSFLTYHAPVVAEFKDPPGTYRVTSWWGVHLTGDTANPQAYVNFQSIPEAANAGTIAQGAFQARLQLAAGSMLDHVETSIKGDMERQLPPFLRDVEIYLYRKKWDAVHTDCLLGRTNVKYILRAKPVDSASTRLIGNVFNGSSLPSLLYEDLCFVPRTYVAGNSLFSMDYAETLDRLASRDFDALNTVNLAAPEGSSPAVSGSGPAGQVEIVQRDPNSVTLQAQLSRPAYVVLLERDDPSWQATIDGRKATVLRANQIFRAVYAGAGQHQIRFEYHQRGLLLGMVISLVTLVALIVLFFKG